MRSVGRPGADRLGDDGRHRPGRAGIGPRKTPTVVLRPPVCDNVARNVLHDQLLAAHAKWRLQTELESAARSGLPPDDRVIVSGKQMLAGTHRRGSGRFLVGTLRHGILRLEDRALRAAPRRAARVDRGIQRAVQRTEPPTLPRPVAERGHHKQVSRSGGRHVGQTHTFGLVARDLLRFVLVQFVGRPATDLQRTEAPARVQITARVGCDSSGTSGPPG